MVCKIMDEVILRRFVIVVKCSLPTLKNTSVPDWTTDLIWGISRSMNFLYFLKTKKHFLNAPKISERLHILWNILISSMEEKTKLTPLVYLGLDLWILSFWVLLRPWVGYFTSIQLPLHSEFIAESLIKLSTFLFVFNVFASYNVLKSTTNIIDLFFEMYENATIIHEHCRH